MKAWKVKAERGSAWLIRLIAWLARTVGRPVCRALLYPIVLYFVLTDGVARRASREFLGRAFGRRARWLDVYAHIHWFAATLLDRVYMASGEFDRFDVSVEGDALVAEALQAGKGCVLLGSHLGSFDLMLLANRALGNRPVTVLMHFDPRARLRRIAGIDDSMVRIVQLGRPDSFMRAYEVLEQGGIVAVLADRTDGAAHLQSDFFGRPAAFPIGPHVLAARTGASVLMCFGLYEGGAKYRIEFIRFGSAAPRGSRGAALQPVVDRYASLLQQYAARHPRNWFNFYPYWSGQ
ncbi:MAG: lipid A biosynthesis acyltransferase [Proteobacteria bacterium]|nr:lipid A biosynthesis acyltransferase [Pseudomonadota bacterium]